MCPLCASVGVLAIAGVVSTAGLAGLLTKLGAGHTGRGEMSS
jgi:hypothetical protein